MKKVFLGITLGSCLLLCGCGKQNEGDVLKELTKNIEKASAYYLEGTMEIVNNEDTYIYNVEASYEKDDNYKVVLINTSNNHEQVILRNDDGVYVVTPSLNKSFKFQSNWPYNNSQIYLLNSIVEDLNNDEERVFTKTDDGYTFTTIVNYPNNSKLVKQTIYLDKDSNLKMIEVMDKDDNVLIKMTFNNIDMKAQFNDNYFQLNSIINEQEAPSEATKETTNIEDVIYPMYLPENTYLTGQETVDTDKGQRLILTFDGDNPFTLIEETTSYEEEHLIIPTYGELELLTDTIAVVSENSINWFSNGIEYYVVSDVVKTTELLEIARSISVIPVASTK